MKELRYLDKYFVKYKYSFLIGIIITIVAQIFSLFTPKLISKSFTIIEAFAKDTEKRYRDCQENVGETLNVLDDESNPKRFKNKL